jgi:hypothetical protein
MTIYKTRIAFSILFLFVFSFVMSCQELKYMVQGKIVDAQIIDNHTEKEERNGEQYEKRVIGYGFQDGQNYRREYADVPLNWSPQDSPTVKVQYIPNWERHSRLLGHNNMAWVYIFFASLVAGAFAVFFLMRQADNP